MLRWGETFYGVKPERGLGEILASSDRVKNLLSVPDDLEFVVLIALGRPVPRERTGVRHPLDELVVPAP